MTTRKAKAPGLPQGATLDYRCDPPGCTGTGSTHLHHGTHYVCGRGEKCPDGPGPHAHAHRKRIRVPDPDKMTHEELERAGLRHLGGGWWEEEGGIFNWDSNSGPPPK